MMEEYVYRNQKKLRCGYTTGSCAAAAAKAAAEMLLCGKEVNTVEMKTPKGPTLRLAVEAISRSRGEVSCAIRKDAGDDADVTNGILIFAALKKREKGILLEGGTGIGRVTKKGLDQPPGAAAINSVPRSMICSAVEEVMETYGYRGGMEILLWIPEGEALAEKTFNPRLGIRGGLSILGTSGIVEPMSQMALLETIRTEMKSHTAEGGRHIILTPGNYGSAYLQEALGLDMEKVIKCSNFIGDSIDMAFEFGIKSLLLIGHIGKLVKLGAGIMNTHSKWGDARMEILCCCAVLAGADMGLAGEILSCATTDEAIELLMERGLLEVVLDRLMCKIDGHLQHRAYPGLEIAAVVFSNQHGFLGKTREADKLLGYHGY